METVLSRSSLLGTVDDLRGAERILAIAHGCNATEYINAPGGRELYDKDDFKAQGIDLKFIVPNLVPYQQFDNAFVPGLSILDVMMFNDPNEVRRMLGAYTLE